MGMTNRLLEYVQAKWKPVWAMPRTKSAFVIVGTAVGVGAFFYPIVKQMFTDSTKEQDIYSKDNLYPIRLQKQREKDGKEEGHRI